MGNASHLSHLTNRIKQTKAALAAGNARALNEQTLKRSGLQGVKEEAFVKLSAKVQFYTDVSLTLRSNPIFDGLPPTELQNENGLLIPKEFETGAFRTTAMDQQRQLYAAARTALLDPAYGEEVMQRLVQWHDAFVRHFVIVGRNPRIRESVVLRPNGLHPQDPAPQAHLRSTYALQGSATLSRALTCAAKYCSDPDRSTEYRSKSVEIKELSLAIAEQFYRDFADSRRPGRYFLYPRGGHDLPVFRGLSHNNSQGYLIEGMRALAELDPAKWQGRLEDLLSFMTSQRDPATSLLHEFDFRAFGEGFPAEAVRALQDIGWQSQDGNETVVLGHTIAGIYAAQSKAIADATDLSRQQRARLLVQDFVDTMNRLGGIHRNGLPANAFQLIAAGTDTFREMKSWPEGAWQAELLWQFLFCADRCGIDLAAFEVDCEGETARLDQLIARSLAFHDGNLFNGTSYVDENGKLLSGRDRAAPINHAADTLRDLAHNLVEAMPSIYNCNFNEIKAYVHRLFSLYDKHADVNEILPLLVATNLEMDFPDFRVRSRRDFKDWYRQIGHRVLWNVHRLERADITVVCHRKYQVDIALTWEGAFRQDGKPFCYAVNQIWRLVEDDSFHLLIERYQVTRFELQPTPGQFKASR